MIILTLNCRGENLHYHLFDWPNRRLLAEGSVSGIDREEGHLHLRGEVETDRHLTGIFPDVDVALAAVLRELDSAILKGKKIAAVSHRVVHGGETFTASVPVDEGVLARIRELDPLAPDYNPPNRHGIEAARRLLPEARHIAIFDTAFHHTLPRHAAIYPLPFEWYERHGVRRYGFHGASHLYLSRRAAALLEKPPAECHLVTVHIDLGISLCAVKNGVSIDTSMGLTPMEGALMEHRCGDIDPGIPPMMMDVEGLSVKGIQHVLNERSGLYGITGGIESRRDVLKGALAGDPRCQLAARMEAYRLKKYIGSYIAALGRPDALVFTLGQRELEADVRSRVLDGLALFGLHLDPERNASVEAAQGEWRISTDDSPVPIWVIPSHEELVMLEDAAAIMTGHYREAASYPYSFAGGDFLPYPKGWL